MLSVLDVETLLRCVRCIFFIQSYGIDQVPRRSVLADIVACALYLPIPSPFSGDKDLPGIVNWSSGGEVGQPIPGLLTRCRSILSLTHYIRALAVCGSGVCESRFSARVDLQTVTHGLSRKERGSRDTWKPKPGIPKSRRDFHTALPGE